jgi:hypothetical protein
MSPTLSTNWGSVESLKLSVRHGCSPNARQMRATVDCDIPVSLAMSRVDQCVASWGLFVSVLSTTRSTWSSVTVRGAPGRGSSANPSKRRATKRERHLDTVAWFTPRRSATSVLVSPLAQASTIFERSARDCWIVDLRTHRSSVARSSLLNTSSAFGRPREPIGGRYDESTEIASLF